MDDKSDKRPAIRQRVKTPIEVRDFAYQLWAYEYGRDTKLTAKALGCNQRTIQRWVERNQWHDRARQELTAIMPDLLEQTAQNLRLGAFSAAKRLNQIARGSLDGKALDVKEVDGLVKIIDRGGFSPIGQAKLPDISPRSPSVPLSPGASDLMERHRSRIIGD